MNTNNNQILLREIEDILLASSKVHNPILIYFNLFSIMSGSQDILIKEKIQLKNQGYIDPLKRSIARTKNPTLKRTLEIELKEHMETEYP